MSSPPPRNSTSDSPDDSRQRLEQLERLWNEKFVQQPKLPTEALLTGALAMALGFGAGLFLLSYKVRHYAWIWISLSIFFGLLNRFFAARWYRKVVVPWDIERRETAARIAQLKGTAVSEKGVEINGKA
jgi:hypothetical protein